MRQLERARLRNANLRRREPITPRPECVSIEKAAARFPGEWILMKVTAVDERAVPTEGQILARAANHKSIWQKFSKLVSPGEKPALPYYVFQAGQLTGSGEDMRATLAQAGEAGAPGAWRHR
jgi:hypothetical protein